MGFFGFTVLVIFEIGFSVFALKISDFSVMVSTVVFVFSVFNIGLRFLRIKMRFFVFGFSLA